MVCTVLNDEVVVLCIMYAVLHYSAIHIINVSKCMFYKTRDSSHIKFQNYVINMRTDKLSPLYIFVVFLHTAVITMVFSVWRTRLF